MSQTMEVPWAAMRAHRPGKRGRESDASLTGADEIGFTRKVNRKYRKEDVCRPFLCGLCPHELCQLTRTKAVACPKVHSLQLRKRYEKAKAREVDNYDRELEEAMQKLIENRDGRISGALKHLEEKDAEEAIQISVRNVTQTPEVMELSKQIKEKLKEADQFDLECKTILNIRALEEVEELRTKRADKQSTLLLDAFNKDGASIPPNHKLGSRMFSFQDAWTTRQKLHICDVCGAFLSLYESGRRLAYHFMGKLHSGYMEIEEKLAELRGEKKKSTKRTRTLNEDDIRGRLLHMHPKVAVPTRKYLNAYYLAHRENYNITAAFSSLHAHEAYIFMGDEYVVVDYVLGMRINKVVDGPFLTCCGFQPLRHTNLECYRLNCAFRCKGTTDLFLFCGLTCLKIRLEEDTKKTQIIECEASVKKLFPCLSGTGFETGIETAFESLVDGLAYLFKREQYALIRYAPKRKLVCIRNISEGFPCLRGTIFEYGIHAAFTSHHRKEVYLFREDCYAVLSFTPGYKGSKGFRLIGEVKEILPNWPCFRGILPRLSNRPPCAHQHSDRVSEYDYE